MRVFELIIVLSVVCGVLSLSLVRDENPRPLPIEWRAPR